MSTARSTTPTTGQTGKMPPPVTAPRTAQAAQTTHAAGTKPSCERIAQRAYEKWMKRGCVHGYDIQDWVEAEKELLSEQTRR